MTLPEELAIEYNNQIQALTEEKTMAYITTAERIGMQKGREEGIQEGVRLAKEQLQVGRREREYLFLLRLLERKFHTVPESYQQQLQAANTETLLYWGERIFKVGSL